MSNHTRVIPTEAAPAPTTHVPVPSAADTEPLADGSTRSNVRDRGQATTEYALILLAAALVAVLVIGWATAGGGAAAIGRLFDSAINAAIDQLG